MIILNKLRNLINNWITIAVKVWLRRWDASVQEIVCLSKVVGVVWTMAI